MGDIYAILRDLYTLEQWCVGVATKGDALSALSGLLGEAKSFLDSYRGGPVPAMVADEAPFRDEALAACLKECRDSCPMPVGGPDGEPVGRIGDGKILELLQKIPWAQLLKFLPLFLTPKPA